MKVGIVVPTYKKELWDKFVNKWNWESKNYDITLYAIEDNPTKSLLDTPNSLDDNHRKHYSWYHIDKDLDENSWIISRRSSAIRSYGYLKAYQDGMDYILTLDDDCYPSEGSETIEKLIDNHLLVLANKVGYSSYFNVGEFFFERQDLWMRGSPIRYRGKRNAFMSVGGWDNNPDLDAWTQLERQHPRLKVNRRATSVMKYSGYTMCGMNILFHRGVTPLMYFLLQGERWGVDRVDDIWAGLFSKKVLDKFDVPVVINGYATIKHERASDALTSLKKEGLTLQETELLWDRILPLKLEGDDFVSSYESLAEQLKPEWLGNRDSGYGESLKEAMKVWSGLFKTR